MKRFKSAFTILFTLSLTLLAVSCIVQFEVRADEQVFSKTILKATMLVLFHFLAAGICGITDKEIHIKKL